MKHFFILLIVSCPFLGLFSIQTAAEDPETPKYTDEQLQKLKAAEEKYKDNPQIMTMINRIKEASGITDSVTEEKESGPPPVMAHGEVITQGSHQQAKEAIRNKDWETAIANYKVLAAEGDTNASLELGNIYELQGNTGAAYTAYKQAAESEDNDRTSKLAEKRIKWFDRKGITGDEEIDQVNQSVDVSSGTSMVKVPNEMHYRSVMPSLATGTPTPVKSAVYYQPMKPRIVKISPQRVSELQHFKPEKYTRTPKS